MFKHFRDARLRTRSTGNFDLTVRKWIDERRIGDSPLSLYGSGATFGDAVFNTDVFAEEKMIPAQFDIFDYGFDVQFEIFNNEGGQDFFLSELLVDFKEMGVRQ